MELMLFEAKLRSAHNSTSSIIYEVKSESDKNLAVYMITRNVAFNIELDRGYAAYMKQTAIINICRIDDIFKNKAFKTFLLEDKGMISILFTNTNTIEILDLWVEPEFRRGGYGRLLLNFIIQQYPNYNLELLVNATNENAIRLYTSLGFESLGKVKSKKSTGIGVNSVRMVRTSK